MAANKKLFLGKKFMFCKLEKTKRCNHRGTECTEKVKISLSVLCASVVMSYFYFAKMIGTSFASVAVCGPIKPWRVIRDNTIACLCLEALKST
jgi:hypothetical protein